jgi:hypothetical protein
LVWRRFGIDTVVSLLTGEEEQELDLVDEAAEARKHDLDFISYPIPDRGIPANPSTLPDLLETVHRELQHGKKCPGALPSGDRKNRVGCKHPYSLGREWSQNRPSRKFPKCEAFRFQRRRNKNVVSMAWRRISYHSETQ